MKSKITFIGMLFVLYGYATNAQTSRDGLKQNLAGSSTLYFTENVGQIKDQYGRDRIDLDFKVGSGNLVMFIGRGKVHYQWTKVTSMDLLSDNKAESVPLEMYRMDVRLLGANSAAQSIAEEKNAFYENHFNIAGTVAGERANTYRKITYKNIYPNIDWILYIKGNQVEYDFLVHPGGKVEDIRISYEGATSLEINPDGSLTAKTSMGSITERSPYSFQVDGKVIPSKFKLNGNELSFEVGVYQGTLTIDPRLDWCSYYGGESSYEIVANNTCDPQGNIYYSGSTVSTMNIATVGSFKTIKSGGGRVLNYYFVKFNSSGVRQWATYYASSDWGTNLAMACDTLGHIYISSVVGADTLAVNVSTPGAHQETFGGGLRAGYINDLFLAKFDTAGRRVWGTYYGGEGEEFLTESNRHVACDGRNVYLCGTTTSQQGIASIGSHQPNFGGGGVASGIGDIFLAKFNEHGVRQWATYYGGSDWDMSPAIAVDVKGNVFLSGQTSSLDAIATPNSYQPSHAPMGTGAFEDLDGFLAKFSSDGVRQWATFFGGSKAEYVTSVSADQNMNVYLSGTTTSSNGIASPGSYAPELLGVRDGFLVQFNASGERMWATYYGGNQRDEVKNIATDAMGKVYICGYTLSDTCIATDNTIQTKYAGGSFWGDGFIACFNDDGVREWGSYFGGSQDECIVDIAVDNLGSLYFCGGSSSHTLATPGSHMDTFPLFGSMNWMQGFMARFCIEVPESEIRILGLDTVCAGQMVDYTAGSLHDVEAYHWELPVGWAGDGAGKMIKINVGKNGGLLRLRVERCGELSEWVDFPVYVLPPDPAGITVDGYTLGTVNTYVSYQWLLNGVFIDDATERYYTVTENGDYSVITVTEKGCIDTSDLYKIRNVSIGEGPEEESIRIYPNPGCTDFLHVSANSPVCIALYGMDGRLLKYSSGKKSMSVRDVKQGVYWIRVSDLNGKLLRTQKWVKI